MRAHYAEGRYLIISRDEINKEIRLAQVLFRAHDTDAQRLPFASDYCGGAGKAYESLTKIGVAYAGASSLFLPTLSPGNGIDGNLETAVVTGRGDGVDDRGAWVQIDLTKYLTGVTETRVDAISIRFDAESVGEVCLNNLLYGTESTGTGQGETSCVSTHGGVFSSRWVVRVESNLSLGCTT